jgi:Bacterial Ig domain
MALAGVAESCNVNVSQNTFPIGVVEARIVPYSSCSRSQASPPRQPPSVELVAPVDGATFSSSLPISATAGDEDGVSKVEFRANGKLLHTDYSAPYSYNWSISKRKLALGLYTITAKAYDAAGLSASDSALVTRIAPTLTSLSVNGQAGARARSNGGTHTRRAHGRVRGSTSGRMFLRLERFARAKHRWVAVDTLALRLGHEGRFTTVLRGLASGRWRAKAMFLGGGRRAPSASRYRYFSVG